METQSAKERDTIIRSPIQGGGCWQTLWQDLLSLDVVVFGKDRSEREKMVHSSNVQAGKDDCMAGAKTDIQGQGKE